MGSEIKNIWHPIVRAEIAQMQAEYQAQLIVARDAKIADGYDVRAVDAIIETWPDQAVEILTELRKAMDHYSFNRWGMYVGVEYDGYIHT